MRRPPGPVTMAHPRRGEEHVDRLSWAHVVLGSRDHLGERSGNAALPGPIQDRCQVGLLSYLSFCGWINDACYRRNPTSFIFPSVLCSLQDLSSLTRVQTRIPCRESISPNRCTARKVPETLPVKPHVLLMSIFPQPLVVSCVKRSMCFLHFSFSLQFFPPESLLCIW